jgi:hypothetical protein
MAPLRAADAFYVKTPLEVDGIQVTFWKVILQERIL